MENQIEIENFQLNQKKQEITQLREKVANELNIALPILK